MSKDNWSIYFSKLVKKENMTTLEEALYKAYVKHLVHSKHLVYKCIQGTHCDNSTCKHVHPFDEGYEMVPYYQNNVSCKYESDDTDCKLKCGSKSGKYCPYLHCDHLLQFTNVITCFQKDCQRHCPICI
jgi:hypothetical protein